MLGNAVALPCRCEWEGNRLRNKVGEHGNFENAYGNEKLGWGTKLGNTVTLRRRSDGEHGNMEGLVELS